jgi:hypothetical protein
MGSKGKVLGLAAAALLAQPATALASTTASVVSGTVGSELSVAAATPAAMTLTHATPGTTSSLVTVTSTQPSWTLQINSGDATPGHMDRVLGSGPATLSNPLEWRLDPSGSYSDLSATPATVTTGSLVGTALVDFRQSLAASDGVSATDSYSETVTYTVT